MAESGFGGVCLFRASVATSKEVSINIYIILEVLYVTENHARVIISHGLPHALVKSLFTREDREYSRIKLFQDGIWTPLLQATYSTSTYHTMHFF